MRRTLFLLMLLSGLFPTLAGQPLARPLVPGVTRSGQLTFLPGRYEVPGTGAARWMWPGEIRRLRVLLVAVSTSHSLRPGPGCVLYLGEPPPVEAVTDSFVRVGAWGTERVVSDRGRRPLFVDGDGVYTRGGAQLYGGGLGLFRLDFAGDWSADMPSPPLWSERSVDRWLRGLPETP